MLTIKILGPGCSNCRRLEQLIQQVLQTLEIEADVSKLTNPLEFVDYDVLATPGLVINDETVCSGRVPSVNELTGFVESALAGQE